MEHYHLAEGSGGLRNFLAAYIHQIEFILLILAFIFHATKYRKQMF